MLPRRSFFCLAVLLFAGGFSGYNSVRPMNRCARLAVVAVLLAANSWAAQTGTLVFTVKDAATGFAAAARIYIAGRVLRTNDSGQVRLTTRSGYYRIVAAAPAYRPLETHFRVEPGQTQPIDLLLTPLHPHAEVLLPALSGSDRVDATIRGYVAESAGWHALAGVTVRADDFGATAVTDARGFFEVTLPAEYHRESNWTPPATTLLFAKPGFATLRLENVLLLPGRRVLRVALKSGTGTETRRQIHRTHGHQTASASTAAPQQPLPPLGAPAASGHTTIFLPPPGSIRVGMNCPTKTTCTSVTAMSLDTYVAGGLNDEWYGSWDDDSLRAGAIAYRSYGAWYVQNPLAPNYDICSTTSCQVWDSDTYSKTDTATAYTSGVMLEMTGAIARSEYSAENNNCGCGDCYTGSAAWPCIYDPHGCGKACNGHGRGMCQWGSQDRAVGGQDWLQILGAYYNPGSMWVSSPLSITSASFAAPTAYAGQMLTLNVSATNAAESEHAQILLVASLCAAGCIDDHANDSLVTVASGTAALSRLFQLPAQAATGAYDLNLALWFDVNENGVLDDADFLLASQTYPGALRVAPTMPPDARRSPRPPRRQPSAPASAAGEISTPATELNPDSAREDQRRR